VAEQSLFLGVEPVNCMEVILRYCVLDWDRLSPQDDSRLSSYKTPSVRGLADAIY
jgi:hypothetical protein